jgi:hypothetical protein
MCANVEQGETGRTKKTVRGFLAQKILRKARAFIALTIMHCKNFRHATHFAEHTALGKDSPSCQHGKLIWEG